MRRSRSPIALDLGEHRVRALQLIRSGDRIAVSAAAVAAVAPARTDGDRRARLQDAARRALRAAPFRGRLATPALRLADIETRHVRLAHDEIERAGERIAAMVAEPPGPPTPVSICPLAISDLVEHGERRREFLCCIAPQPAIDELIELCEALGKVPDRIDLAPVAQARALLHAAPQESFAHVDVGVASSRVTVVRSGEVVLMRTAAIGGDALRRAVHARLQLAPETLTTLAAGPAAGDATLTAAVVEAIAEPLEGLVRRIADGLRYIAALFHGRAVTSLRVSGASARLPGLVPYLERRLGVAAAAVVPFAGIDAAAIAPVQHAEFTLALGLALGGLPA